MAGRRIPQATDAPPYKVIVGDRMFVNNPPPLGEDRHYRKLYASTEPYLVDGTWKVMVEDGNDDGYTLEVPLATWHVVGKPREKPQSKSQEKPTLKKGDVVQLRYCPRYPSLESHTAKLTGDPYEAFGKWQAPIRYFCSGRKTDIMDCQSMALIGHSSTGILINKIRKKLMKLSKSAIITAVVLGFMAIIGLWLAGNYNSLVQASNAVDNSKAKIDTQLERRYELVDNIVASVKGSQAQESDVFKAIADARRVGSSSSSTSAEADANATIDQQIQLLPRLQEAYPELRSNEQVTRLIQELQGTAGQVATARDNYNNTVTNYNTNITSFPKNIFAGIFDFDKRELFKATEEAKTNPKVDLNRE